MPEAFNPPLQTSAAERPRWSVGRAALIAPLLALLALLRLLMAVGASSARAASSLPKVRHVFVIVLENQGYAATFGTPGADPYLAQALPAQGALLENYYATGHESNDNYISLVSGQPPNAQNQADCPKFDDFTGAIMLSSGVETGTGCVYPAEVPNIGTQLSARKLSWKAYQQDMGNDPNRETAACGHPAVGATDETQKAEAGDGYATRHDPFVYFHSVIDEPAYCDAHVVALGSPTGVMPAASLHGETGLATDLASTREDSSPLLHHAQPLQRRPRLPLRQPAQRRLGARRHRQLPRNLGPQDHELAGLPRKRAARDRLRRGRPTPTATACCEETPGPGSPAPGISGPGGGRVGAVLLSPFIKPGTVSDAPPTTTTPPSPPGRRCSASAGSPTRHRCPPSSELTCSPRRSSAQTSRQVLASADVELGEHTAEMELHGLDRDEQLRGDLTVGQPLCGQLGNPLLAGGQGALARGRDLARPRRG